VRAVKEEGVFRNCQGKLEAALQHFVNQTASGDGFSCSSTGTTAARPGNASGGTRSRLRGF